MTSRRPGALLCLTLALAGCGLRGVSVPELDALRSNEAAVRPTSRPEDVRAALGPPPFTEEDTVKIRWWYPIRALTGFPPRFIPAARLTVWLDDAGRLDDWSFVHPVSGARLPIRETLAEADAWFESFCAPPARIELATVLRKGASRDAVVAGMRWFPPRSPTWLETVLVQTASERGRETLTFYADRPSPRYIPPFYLEILFPKISPARTTTGIHGAGGACK